MIDRSRALAARVAANDVTVIVPVRNEADSLEPFLSSLLDQEVGPQELILVDAGSTDSSAQIIRERAAASPALRLIDAGASFPGRARNVAIRAAGRSWIAMTDAGTIVDAGWLAALMSAAAQNPDADVVFGTYEPLVRTVFDKCVALAFVAPARFVDGMPFRGPTTASLMLRKDVWERLGGFPDDLRAGEDLVFFDRLEASGHRVAQAPRAIVRWAVPSTWARVFNRFRLYSLHTMKAGLAHRWQRSVLAMDAVAAVFIALAVFVHWAFIAVPIVGLLARTVRSIRRRPDIAATMGPSGIRELCLVGALLFWIDLATIAGAMQYVWLQWTRR